MSIGRPTRGSDEQHRDNVSPPASVSRYDVVLALLPLAVLLPAVASGLFGVTLHTALAGGSLFGVAVLVDALFLNPPTKGGRTN